MHEAFFICQIDVHRDIDHCRFRYLIIINFSISEESNTNRAITSITINSLGDLIAMGSSDLGQLLVWEWQSEQQALKQQSHFSTITCVTYSPNGQNLATGGEDGKVCLF